MERAARPYIAAAAVLAAGGLIAATPAVTPSLPDVQVPNIGLTSDTANDPGAADIFQLLLDNQANQSLIDSVNTFNGDLAGADGKLIDSIVSSLPAGDQAAVENAVQQFLDGANPLLGAGGDSFLGTLGAGAGLDPTTLNLDGGASQAADPALGTNQLAAVQTGDLASNGVINVVQTAAASFYDDLVASEAAFNASLASQEQAIEQAVLGNNSALGGVADQSFQLFNAMYQAQEQGFNGVVGVTDGGPVGSVADLQTMFDQSQGLLAAITALQASDFENAFANYDADAANTALLALLATLASGPFADAFTAALGPA